MEIAKKIIATFAILVFFSSCVSRKEMAYMQNYKNNNFSELNTYEVVIKPDDMLLIEINTEKPNPEITAMYNLTGDQSMQQFARIANTYLVDNEGFIEMPTLGRVKVGGLKKTELNKLIKTKANEFLKNPIINIRLLNFEVTVGGEVNQPGVFQIESERITLIEALTLAGDISIYGKRNNILVVREINNKPTFNIVDITKRDFMHSDFYYLKQNDAIYVEPRKSKIDSTTFGSNITT
jgi:polysaccharide export outer membrane protein